MKPLLTLLTLFSLTISFAQTNSINYKALIKDNNGNIVASQNIDIRFTIIADTGPTDIYQETHTGATTDANGIVIVNIGEGTPNLNLYADIDWGSDAHSLKVEIDIEQDASFVDLGTTPFLSVPYALHAQNVSGLEKITESGKTGWRLIGRNPANYGNIGTKAIDFSDSDAASTTHGATGQYAFATGIKTIASGPVSTAIGDLTTASGGWAIATGYGTTASKDYSTAMGFETEASGNYSTAMGANTTASGVTSTAIGRFTRALATESTAMGYLSTASGLTSTAMGSNTTASGSTSTAMGAGSTASGLTSTAMGYGTIASKDYSTAMGFETEASGNNSTAMGFRSEASGSNSTAMGFSTRAFSNSTAMGNHTEASGDSSTAMGINTTASGNSSTAMGFNTTASGENSTTMGFSVTAKSYTETAIGLFNTNYTPSNANNWIATDRLFVIGNGTADNARSNALTVLKNGTITAPSFSNAEINTAGNTALITKGYADANYTNETVESLNFPTFGVNYQNYGGQWEITSYYKHNQRVYLEGVISKTSGTITSGDVLFTLPVGYRPQSTIIATAYTGDFTPIRINIETDGDVVIASTTVDAWLTINGISFRL